MYAHKLALLREQATGFEHGIISSIARVEMNFNNLLLSLQLVQLTCTLINPTAVIP